MYGTLFGTLFVLDWLAYRTLEYYSKDGIRILFSKYEIDPLFGTIRHKKSGNYVSFWSDIDGYNNATIYDDDGKQKGISVARAVLSTFVGKPADGETADHLDCTNKNYNSLASLVWMNARGQINNRNTPDTMLCAYRIRGKIEYEKNGKKRTLSMVATSKQWVALLNKKNILNPFGRPYTKSMIDYYTSLNKYGFSYLVYEDLKGEIWKKVENSKTPKGHLEVSNMNRIARITKNARNVVWGDRLCIADGYPAINIRGKNTGIHIVVFYTFFPEEYKARTHPNVLVLHKHDNKLDFRPDNLYLGSKSQNSIDAHKNGKHDDTLTAEKPCESYIDGKFEKRHDSARDAMRYLRSIGKSNAKNSNISAAVRVFEETGVEQSAYDRTWKPG
jgi:hypothetical protein